MKRRTKSPKGSRGSASRGGGRGRGRGGRGGSRGGGISESHRRTPSSSISDGPSTSSRKSFLIPPPQEEGHNNGNSSNKAHPSGDYYLHKKFKKLTNTTLEDEKAGLVHEAPTSSSSLSSDSKPTSLTNGLVSHHGKSNNTINSDNSAIESPVIKHNSQSLDNHSAQQPNSTTSANMVYKPKFRMASESETDHNMAGNGGTILHTISSSQGGGETSSSSSCSSTSEPGRISSLQRLDRKSLDDRISKIIDENQSLLEWPEHFTKKLKSHTRSSHSSSSSSNQPRTNNQHQLSIMSGGSATELHSPKLTSQFPVSSLPPHNGLVRHASFDMSMTSAGGGVELLTNPLILKAQADMLKSSLSQVVIPPNSPSIADLSFPLAVAANASSIMVPKKRRRLSPTPSRLCGGEVSELPMNETVTSKGCFQDVDVNVRFNNCSGAKVTIRTSGANGGGGSGGSMNFGRFMDPVPSPLSLDTSSFFFPNNSNNSDNSSKNLFSKAEEQHNSSLEMHSSPKRKNPRSPESRLPSSPLPLVLEPKIIIKEEQSRNQESIPLISATKTKTAGDTVQTPSKDSSASAAILRFSDEDIPAKTKTETSSKPSPSSSNNSSSLQLLPTNPKRPNFLALKPVNNLKKKEVGVLPSPETPRVAKSYNQMSINGNAYTYLGFKVSTRSSYTCLFKPQPMFIPQHSDPKLSMYSHWQPCPKDPKDPELNMSTNDSRVNGRKDLTTLYTVANGKTFDTMTVSSPDKQAPISSPFSEANPLDAFTNHKKSESVTSLSRSSEPVPPHSSKTGTGLPSSLSTTTFTNSKPQPAGGSLTNGTSLISSSTMKSTARVASSSSELSSADESNNFSKMEYKSNSSERDGEDGPLALVFDKRDSTGGKDDNSSASEDLAKLDREAAAARVKIMEGGFESNEAYTYVRGRGRGRYVCEACGIRCKKPSMLRKHLKTHTDLRPYTCKLCNFSFKTKGNLTKHQKSKAHHKRCMAMGIHPESTQSLESTGPNIDSNSDGESDDDEEETGDTDSQCDEGDGSASGSGNDSESVEKEIALSLLDLSRMSRRPSESETNSSDFMKKITPSPPRLPANQADGNGEAPMDLTLKSNKVHNPSHLDEPGFKRQRIDLNGTVRSIGKVGEAQRWDHDNELLANGTLNLKKVLNVGSTSVLSNGNKTFHSTTHGPLQREIKQEVSDYPGDIEVRRYNGYSCDMSRKRQDSDTSTTSSINSSFGGNSGPSATVTSSDAQTSRSRGNLTPPLRLHQPWLSPPDRKVSESESNKSDDVKVDVNQDKSGNGVGANEHNFNRDGREVASPNGKIFTNNNNIPIMKPQAEFRQPSGAQALVKEDGKCECNVCGKTFARPSQLTLHMNIHYLERPFRCEPCGVSFRTKGHLIKHRRSSSHDCKVYLTEAWGVANEENPRPFKCPDCKIAFRIHGHLAKHLRSKMHIMRMECLGKLPFGIYVEMEKSGMNLNEIDTTDCDMSLVSLQNVARKIYGETWTERLAVPTEENV